MRGHIHFDDLCKFCMMCNSYSSAGTQGALECEMYSVMDSLEIWFSFYETPSKNVLTDNMIS